MRNLGKFQLLHSLKIDFKNVMGMMEKIIMIVQQNTISSILWKIYLGK